MIKSILLKSAATCSSLRTCPADLGSCNSVGDSLVTYQPKYTSTPVASVAGGHSRNSSISSSFSTISTREAGQANQNREVSRDDDDKLFEFLNAKGSSSNQGSGKRSRPFSPKKEHEGTSIASNDPSIDVISVSSEDEKQRSGQSSPDNVQKQEESFVESVIEVPLPEQNARLREEIKSLTKEISLLTKRNIDSDTELKRLNRRLENWQSQLNASDAALRELQSRESDLAAQLDAKDSQTKILKVRLHETDEKLRVQSVSLDNLREEYDALVKEREENTINFDDNLESLRRRIQELEGELLKEKDSLNQNQSESMMQMGQFEENQRQLIDELTSLQRELKAEKASRKELEKQVRQSKNNYETLETEFSEYKLKAQKTLQTKEDLIRALNRSRNDGDEGIADTSDAQIGFEQSNDANLVLQAQCDSLVLETQDLREKNDQLKEELARIKSEELDSLNGQISNLTEELDEVRRYKHDLEQDMKQGSEELKYYKDDIAQTKESLGQRISDRDQEIEKLRKQLVAKRSSSSGASIQELEARVKSLTENLLQKQTLVEQMTSEKHSLSLQLERSEARLRTALENVNNSAGPGSVAIGMVSSASASNLVNRGGYRPFTDYEDPQDGQVTRRVKRAYGQLDSFSIRLGTFLRSYPSARGLLLIYILILHIWVFFILFSYRPEIHDLDG
ncbi:Golgin subfamily A member 5 [Halotydeus destructor]|nr:Golgin subfamily A member 5 [Halotydeus destructor]